MVRGRIKEGPSLRERKVRTVNATGRFVRLPGAARADRPAQSLVFCSAAAERNSCWRCRLALAEPGSCPRCMRRPNVSTQTHRPGAEQSLPADRFPVRLNANPSIFGAISAVAAATSVFVDNELGEFPVDCGSLGNGRAETCRRIAARTAARTRRLTFPFLSLKT